MDNYWLFLNGIDEPEQAGRDPASETMTRHIMPALQGLLREPPGKGYGLEK